MGGGISVGRIARQPSASATAAARVELLPAGDLDAQVGEGRQRGDGGILERVRLGEELGQHQDEGLVGGVVVAQPGAVAVGVLAPLSSSFIGVWVVYQSMLAAMSLTRSRHVGPSGMGRMDGVGVGHFQVYSWVHPSGIWGSPPP